MTWECFDGRFETARPLNELGTLFDMTGLALEVAHGTVRSNDAAIAIDTCAHAQHARATAYSLNGRIDAARHDPEDVLSRLAMAMEADGIRFTLRLLDGGGDARVTYESDR